MNFRRKGFQFRVHCREFRRRKDVWACSHAGRHRIRKLRSCHRTEQRPVEQAVLGALAWDRPDRLFAFEMKLRIHRTGHFAAPLSGEQEKSQYRAAGWRATHCRAAPSPP